MKTTTSISDLKSRLSAYLDLVRQGEEVFVTDRGRLIARLGPVTGDSAVDGRREMLLRTGRMLPPRAPLPPDFLALPRPSDPEGRSIAVILEERDSTR